MIKILLISLVSLFYTTQAWGEFYGNPYTSDDDINCFHEETFNAETLTFEYRCISLGPTYDGGIFSGRNEADPFTKDTTDYNPFGLDDNLRGKNDDAIQFSGYPIIRGTLTGQTE